MATHNNSSFILDYRNDIDLVSIISVFDGIDDKSVKESYIQAFKNSKQEPYRETGFFLEDRYIEPPWELPDSNIMSVDVLTLDKEELEAWAKDVRLLVILKYSNC